ncbi:MAG: hypothetical protein V9F04_13365 [Dermatophilaceae bacterium]
MTVWKDTRELGDQVAQDGRRRSSRAARSTSTTTKTYDNGKKVVPTYLLDPDGRHQGRRSRSSWSTPGFYKAADLGL